MLSATEFFPVTPLLHTVLWIEAVIYLCIGTYEIFDDFLARPPLWANTPRGINAWIRLQDVVARKMHAGLICRCTTRTPAGLSQVGFNPTARCLRIKTLVQPSDS